MERGSGSAKDNRREMLRVTPLANWMFQKIFGEKGGERVARALVNLILVRVGLEPLGDIDYVVADTSLPNTPIAKAPRVDVLLVSGDRAVDLEAERTRADVEGKSTYYSALTLANRVGKGVDKLYRNLPQTVVIMLLQGRMQFPDSEQYITAGRIHWELDGGCLPGDDHIVYIVCELDKIAQRYTVESEEVMSDELTAWLYVLARGYRDPREMEKIMGRIMGMKEFGERYDLAVGDPDALDAYWRYVMSEMTMNDIEAGAREEGFKTGFDSGYDNARDSLVSALREQGVPEDVIRAAVAAAAEA